MNLICHDIIFSEDVYVDYDRAPTQVQKRFDRLITMISQARKIPPSVNAHKAKFVNDGTFIGYVTASRTSWRVLFRLENNVMVIDRLLSHKEQDDLFRDVV